MPASATSGTTGSKANAKSLEAETLKVEPDIGQLMDRIVATDSDTLIAAYERRVRALEEQRVKIARKHGQLRPCAAGL